MNNDFFKFEDNDLDFPLYNGKPNASLMGWLLLLAGFILHIAFSLGLWNYIPGVQYWAILTPIVPTLILLIPLAYCCGGNLGLIFQIPKLKDMKVVFICIIAYFAFTLTVSMILRIFGIVGTPNPLGEVAVSAPGFVVILLVVSLVGEELFKLTSMLMVMAVVYRFTKDRKTSMIVGLSCCCVIFGLIHLSTYNYNVVQCLAMIGLGCAIHMFPYLKTKNLTNSYLTHLLMDLLIFVPVMLMGTV